MSASTVPHVADDRNVDRTFLLIDDGSISMWIFFEPARRRRAGR
jgi:hypothetical protein